MDQGMVNLTHGPLEEFNMMGMTMNFMVSKTIDMADFTIGQEVHVEIIKSDTGMYEVRTVHFMDDMKKMTGMGEANDQGDSQ
jgi:Cu(I)/Ag(I) efflux system membrane fusion protein